MHVALEGSSLHAVHGDGEAASTGVGLQLSWIIGGTDFITGRLGLWGEGQS